jgi:phage terminase Nu1 subunit (DNA packaging protein)
MNLKTCRTEVCDFIPAEAIVPGRPVRYQLGPAIQTRIDRVRRSVRQQYRGLASAPSRARNGDAADGEADPLLAGPADSPELERYRKFRADLSELDLRKRRGELVEVADLREALGVVALRLRTLGLDLTREFGADAQRHLDKALADVEAGLAALAEKSADRGLTNGVASA